MIRMAVSHILRLSLVVLLIVGISCSGNGDTPDPDCQADDLAQKCREFIAILGPRIDPSPECCSAVQKADIPCLCKNIPDGAENYISMEKVVYVVGKCGKSLPHGSKCGSYTVP